MKITAIRIHLLENTERLQMTGYKGGIQKDIVLCEVQTADGFTGFNSAWVPRHSVRTLGFAARDAARVAIGADADFIEDIWQRNWHATRQTLHLMGPGLLDTAIWDARAKAAGKPLAAHLGGHRTRIMAYASTFELPTVEAYVDACCGYVEQGFRAVKLHPYGDVTRDLKLYRAVRDALPETILMTDCVGMHDRTDAMRIGKLLEELDYHWYEEPLPDGDLAGYADLARNLSIPVAGVDSTRLGLGQYAQYIAAGAFDIVRADAGRQGISFCRKVATVAEAFSLNFEPHGYGPGLTQAANLHLGAAIRNCQFFEMPVPIGSMDIEVASGIGLDREGFVSLPAGPGLGLEVDWDKVKALTTDCLDVRAD
ncbi:MAG: enolase C-terminal domain-like protein [Lautropia sp.]